MTRPPVVRRTVAGMTLSAAALVGILLHEGYTDRAVIPVKGDVPTIGFGTTTSAAVNAAASSEKRMLQARRSTRRQSSSRQIFGLALIARRPSVSA